MTPIFRFSHRRTGLLLGHGLGLTPDAALVDLCALWGYDTPQAAGVYLDDLEVSQVDALAAWRAERKVMAALWCDRWESQPVLFCPSEAEAAALGAFCDDAARFGGVA